MIRGHEPRACRSCDRGAALLVAPGERDRHAFLRQALDAGLADPGGPTCDEGHTTLQVLIHRHAFSTPVEWRSARMPPSTRSTAPLQKDESGETKKATAAAVSVAVPMRPAGGSSQPVGSRSTRPATVVAMPGAVSPGATRFTRMPSLPSSVPSICARTINARFETEYAPTAGSTHTPASEVRATIEPPPAARRCGRQA